MSENQNMNLAFVCSSHAWGGLEMNVIRLAEWLTEKGWFIKLYLVRNTKIDEQASLKSLPVTYIKKHRKYYDYRQGIALGKLLRNDKVDIVLISHKNDMSVCASAKFFVAKQVKLIYQQQMQLGVAKRHLLHTIRFSFIDVWVTLLEILKTEVLERTRVPERKIRVIPLCQDFSRLTQSTISKQEARELLNVSAEVRLLGIIGRIDPHKGQHIVISAVKSLIEMGEEVELLIVGEATLGESQDYFDKLKNLIIKNGLQGKVHFRPFMNDVSAFYRAIDLFVLASSGETFGMVTIEAMSAGCAIVGTDSVGTPEILGNGVYGKLYQPGNIEQLTEVIAQAFSNPSEMKAIGERAKQEALAKYNHERECELFAELFRSL